MDTVSTPDFVAGFDFATTTADLDSHLAVRIEGTNYWHSSTTGKTKSPEKAIVVAIDFPSTFSTHSGAKEAQYLLETIYSAHRKRVYIFSPDSLAVITLAVVVSIVVGLLVNAKVVKVVKVVKVAMVVMVFVIPEVGFGSPGN